jgi:hypothetical protein
VSLNGTVQAVLQPGRYLPSLRYTILNTTGTLTGSFAGTVTNYPFLLPTLSYDANDVFLTMTPGGFARGAATPNQAAVGAVLDQNVAAATGDFADVITAFSLLDRPGGAGFRRSAARTMPASRASACRPRSSS